MSSIERRCLHCQSTRKKATVGVPSVIDHADREAAPLSDFLSLEETLVFGIAWEGPSFRDFGQREVSYV